MSVLLVNVLGVDATGKSTLSSHLAACGSGDFGGRTYRLDRLDEFSNCFVGRGLVESIHGTNLGLRLSGDAVSRIADTMAILADCTFSLEVALSRAAGPIVLFADRGFPGHMGIQAVRIGQELGVDPVVSLRALLDLYRASLNLARQIVPERAIVECDVHLVATDETIGARNVARGRPEFSPEDWSQLRAAYRVNEHLLGLRRESGVLTVDVNTTTLTIEQAGDAVLALVARVLSSVSDSD